MKIRSLCSPLSTALLGAALGLFTAALQAATIPVTNLTDSGEDSLRDAIAAAAPGDTVDATGLSGIITLTSGQLVVDKNLTIKGPGADRLTISGNRAFRVFNIPPNTTTSISGLTIADGVGSDSLNTGGGIYAVGSLTLSDCTFRGNAGGRADDEERQVGGAITSYGNLTLDHCTVTGSTGVRAALWLGGSQVAVAIDNSTITQNGGNGISAQGSGASITLSHSTLSENLGHALLVLGDEVSVVNSTISQNFVGILVRGAGRARVSHSTILSNRVGIDGDDNTISIDNSIVAKNSTRDGGWGQGGGLVFTSLGYNLMGNGDGIFGLGPLDLFGTGSSPLDPLLGPLQNNGGPTLTHALLAGSPAIDAGGSDELQAITVRGDIGLAALTFNGHTTYLLFDVTAGLLEHSLNALPSIGGVGGSVRVITNPDYPDTFFVSFSGGTLAGQDQPPMTVVNDVSDAFSVRTVSDGGPLPAVDQRGFPRVVNLVDIGAFEFGSCLPHVTVMNTHDSGYGSLRQALADVCDDGSIDFDPSLRGQTITLTSGQLVALKSYTLTGPGADLLTISGNRASRVFNIPDGTSAWISGLTIADGVAPNDSLNGGGGIFVVGNLFLDACTIRDNRVGDGSTGTGGGILYQATGFRTLKNCTVRGNQAGNGGGIASRFAGRGGTLEILHSTLSGNRAAQKGGGIASISGWTLVIVNSTLSGNSAAGEGGAVYNYAEGRTRSTLQVLNSTLSGNWAFNAWAISNFAEGRGDEGYADVEIGNTILQTGSGPTGSSLSSSSIDQGRATFTSLGYNLCADDGRGFLTAAGDVINTDPRLGPLQNNGGPTLTHALLAGSPALDGGDPAFDPSAFTPPLTADQRGLPRVYNGHIDIGAFEFDVLNTAPQVACPAPAAFDCAPPTGLAVILEVAVTDPDAGQTLTVTLKEGADVLDTRTVATPVNGASVTFGELMLSPGSHSLSVEISDGTAVNRCDTSVSIVTDTEPPQITRPANLEVPAGPGNTGAVVNYPAPGASDNCTVANVTCTPAAGSTFPVGTTTVVCTVTDAAGLTATCSFTVTVLSAEEQIRRCIALVDGFDPKKEKQLMNHLEDSLKELAKDKKDPLKKACKKLDEFIKKVEEALKKRQLTPAQAAQLITCATQAQTTLGCR